MKLLFALILSLVPASAKNDFRMISLQDASVTTLDKVAKKHSLAIVFKEDCTSCAKQVKDLGCFPQDKIFLIGSFGPEKPLREEYKRFKVNYPAYYMNHADLRKFGLRAPVTPQIIDFTNQPYRVFYGYRKCEEYKQKLEGA